jgi:phosphate-selective porin OprO and OprP
LDQVSFVQRVLAERRLIPSSSILTYPSPRPRLPEGAGSVKTIPRMVSACLNSIRRCAGARIAVLLLVAFASPPLPGATVEERLAELEKKVSELASENASLKQQLGAAKEGRAPVFVRPGGQETKLALGGFLQAHAEFGDAPDSRYTGIGDRFLARRARLYVTATFAEDFSVKLEADLSANTIGSTSGVRGQMTDGFVQWAKYPEASVRLGQFKTPFGYEQLASDTKIYTIERALPSDRLTVGRQVGAAVFGELAGKRVNYQGGLFNGNGVNTSINDNDAFMWAGRVAGSLVDGPVGGQPMKWTAGINALTSDDTGTFRGRRTGYGWDSQLVSGALDVWAEYLRQESDPRGGASTTAEGWSLLGAWRFDPKWQGVLRYETYDSDVRAAGTEADVWTLGLNYFIKADDLKLSLNYLLGDPVGAKQEQGRLIGRMQVIF